MTIKLVKEMESVITDGSRIIPVGTEMKLSSTYLSWTYFKGDGYTLVLQGWAEAQKQERLGNINILEN